MIKHFFLGAVLKNYKYSIYVDGSDHIEHFKKYIIIKVVVKMCLSEKEAIRKGKILTQKKINTFKEEDKKLKANRLYNEALDEIN